MKDAQVQLRFDYTALEPETRHFVWEQAERVHKLARQTAASIVLIGQLLTEVKERLGHGVMPQELLQSHIVILQRFSIVPWCNFYVRAL